MLNCWTNADSSTDTKRDKNGQKGLFMFFSCFFFVSKKVFFLGGGGGWDFRVSKYPSFQVSKFSCSKGGREGGRDGVSKGGRKYQ